MDASQIPYDFLVLALRSQPSTFGIPGLAERALSPCTAEGARKLCEAINESPRQAVSIDDSQEQQRLMTVVFGGGGVTGVELAGALAEELPDLARRYGAPPELSRAILVEASPTILAGSSPD